MNDNKLQQYLPFTVLKLTNELLKNEDRNVATVLTVYGIETRDFPCIKIQNGDAVATVLTVYGIETINSSLSKIQVLKSCNSTYRLRY